MKKFYVVLLLCAVSFTSVLGQFSQKYALKNLGRKVNTGYHEAAPVISLDGKTLYFFVSNHHENTYGKEGSQDVWYSELQEDGLWGPAQHIKKPLNDNRSNQVFNILPDGRIFIRGGKSKNSKGFSFTRRTGDNFEHPVEVEVEGFDKMNLGKFYGATISSDGKHMIIYMSEKEGSPFSDLYISHLLENGDFSKPVRLPENINTSRDEFGPYMAPDDKKLYFSSNRKDIGFGSADIYVVERLDESWGKWSDPVNVGKPINTSAFDAYLSVDGQDNIFVTMAGDPRDGGNLDIFQLVPKTIHIALKGMIYNIENNFPLDGEMIVLGIDTIKSSINNGYSLELPNEGDFAIRVSSADFESTTFDITIPEVFNDTVIVRDFPLAPVKKFAFLKGNIYDQKTNEQISAHLSILHELEEKFEDENTTLDRQLETPGWYFITASAEGYLDLNDSVYYDGDFTGDLQKHLYLTPIEVGATVRLNNIYFDFDKTTLQALSYKELDKVVEFLKNNENVEIEISGHTDSKGDDAYNNNLSQGRAQSVVDYLITQGIASFRLTAQGYGESKPLEANDTEEGRAENRRVEFIILKK